MKEFITELSKQIFGEYPLVFYVAYFFFVFFGIMFSSSIVALKTRDVKSTRTPEKFSFTFLIQDNWLRICVSLMTVFVIVRFGQEYYDKQPTHGGALALGFCFDLIIIQVENLRDRIRTVFMNLFQKS